MYFLFFEIRLVICIWTRQNHVICAVQNVRCLSIFACFQKWKSYIRSLARSEKLKILTFSKEKFKKVTFWQILSKSCLWIFIFYDDFFELFGNPQNWSKANCFRIRFVETMLLLETRSGNDWKTVKFLVRKCHHQILKMGT